MILARINLLIARFAVLAMVLLVGGCTYARPIPQDQDREIVDADTSEAELWGTGVIVEAAPELIGGLSQLSARVQYPAAARAEEIEGRVFVQFWVREDGRVDDLRVVIGLHPLLDAEALRVVREEATFHPARQRGKPVAMRMSLPIEFRL